MTLFQKVESAIVLALFLLCVVMVGYAIDHLNKTMDHIDDTLDKVQYDLTVIGRHDKSTKTRHKL